MAARCRLGILQSWLAVLQSCLSILQSRPVSPQSSPRRSSVLALYFDQLRARFTESTPPAAAKSHVSFAGFAPSRRFARCKKQKSRHFCNFFAIRDSPSLLQSGKEPSYSHFCCILGLNPRLRKSRQSLIAKKLQSEAIFCFWASGPASRRCLGRDARPLCPSICP